LAGNLSRSKFEPLVQELWVIGIQSIQLMICRSYISRSACSLKPHRHLMSIHWRRRYIYV
jgi:hypothetical protein